MTKVKYSLATLSTSKLAVVLVQRRSPIEEGYGQVYVCTQLLFILHALSVATTYLAILKHLLSQ